MKVTDKTFEKKKKAYIITIILLLICLIITTFALVSSTLNIENHFFKTGFVSINLNDGKPVISEHEFIFEPGMTVEKDFFIENNSSDDVYYKLYFDNVTGDLGKVLDVTIKDRDKVLYSGTAFSLSEDKTDVCDDILKESQKKDLSIVFHYPESSQNETQDKILSFDLCAKGVQVKNNPQKAMQ